MATRSAKIDQKADLIWAIADKYQNSSQKKKKIKIKKKVKKDKKDRGGLKALLI